MNFIVPPLLLFASPLFFFAAFLFPQGFSLIDVSFVHFFFAGSVRGNDLPTVSATTTKKTLSLKTFGLFLSRFRISFLFSFCSWYNLRAVLIAVRTTLYPLPWPIPFPKSPTIISNSVDCSCFPGALLSVSHGGSSFFYKLPSHKFLDVSSGSRFFFFSD